MVDFGEKCSVLFFFENKNGEIISMKYERPQAIDDYKLNAEAKVNANDMIKKKLYGAKELVAIGIARSEMQYKNIINKARNGFS